MAAVVPACGGDNNNANNPTCSAASCDDGNPCNGTEACTADGTCAAGTPLADGTSCGDGQVCQAGACAVKTCGNGKLDPGEDCDGGEGCTAACKFECSDSPATQCVGIATANACQTFTCTDKHTCKVVTDLDKRAQPCDQADPTKVCFAGQCTAKTGTCGDGTLDPGEDCDDGNTANLDGCDSACRLEQDARIISLQQQFTHDAFCTKDALGEALAEAAQPTIQATWDQPVGDGSMSIAFKFLGLDRALGPDSVADFSLGFVNNSPVNFDPNNPDPNYNGANDLDWWYTVDPTSVDATGTPKVQLDAKVDHGHLTAGPGTVTLNLLFALSPATVQLFHTVVDARFDPQISAPLTSNDGNTPGHLTSEHVDPDLRTFVISSSGQLCSDVSAKSLFEAVIPPLLAGTCQQDGADPNNPIPVFSNTNTLLDVFVHGCAIFDNPAATIGPAQPDGSLDGATYHLAVDPTSLIVATCTRNGAPDDLDHCLANATYSSSFKFKSDRVILRRAN